MCAVRGAYTVCEKGKEFWIFSDMSGSWFIDGGQADIVVVEGVGREKEEYSKKIAVTYVSM